MKTLPSLIRYHHAVDPATITFVNYAAFVPTLTSKQPTPSPFPLYIPNYCNFLYINLPKTETNRLQHIQNSLARTVANKPKYSHITPLLESLHWLKLSNAYNMTWFFLLTQFSQQVKLLTCKISSFFKLTIILVALMSHCLSVCRLFSENQYASPHLWNKLPISLREPVSLFCTYLNPFFSSPLSTSTTLHSFTLNSNLTFLVNLSAIDLSP